MRTPYCFVADQLSVPDPLQPEILKDHFRVPLASVNDWKDPAKSDREKEAPATGTVMLRFIVVDPLGHE
jgi:hypothetical protein